jgi:adenosylhomocysteinase
MDGYRVMPMRDAVKLGDIFVTATGDINVIDSEHWALIKDGAIVCNSGHFNVELNLPALGDMAREIRYPRQNLGQYVLNDGRIVHVLAEGRLVNLAAAEGHPASVMDMSFANQALSAEYLRGHSAELERKVYAVPTDIDQGIARLKLASMSVQIDTLTAEQEHYLHSWEEGT